MNWSVDWLTDWLNELCLTPFSTLLQSHRGGQCTYPCFHGMLFTSFSHNIFFRRYCLLFDIDIVESTDSVERAINPVATTILSPRKESCPSPGIETATSCSQVLYAPNRAIGPDNWNNSENKPKSIKGSQFIPSLDDRLSGKSGSLFTNDSHFFSRHYKPTQVLNG